MVWVLKTRLAVASDMVVASYLPVTGSTYTKAALIKVLDVEVTPRVNAAITAAPAVAAAAAAAVDARAAALDIVLHDDPGAPETVNDWSYGGKVVEEFVVDNVGRVAFMRFADGSKLDPLDTGGGGGGGGGDTSLVGVAACGDSLTAGYNGEGQSYPGTMAGLVPVPVSNFGRSAWTSTEIAVSNGGFDLFVTVSGNTIPASGFVSATVLTTGAWRAGSSRSFEGKLGGISGILTKSATESWSFTRSAPGSATDIGPEARFVSDFHPGARIARIIWAGRNNVSVSTVTRDVRAMVADARRHNVPFLVLPILNSQQEPSGDGTYNTIVAISASFTAEYGPDFYDLRGYLIRHGLADAGLSATWQDLAAISEDRIPPQLMSDDLHLTPAGYVVVGKRLAKLTIAKGWYL